VINMQKKLVVTSSPLLRNTAASTRGIMGDVILAMLPTALAAVWFFGAGALSLILVSVISAVLAELIYQRLTHQKSTIGDLSAVVTGMLLAFNLPANAPWWMAAIGSILAIVLVKQMFGGIGQNFINPALAARTILMLSWAGLMAATAVPAGGQLFGLNAVEADADVTHVASALNRLREKLGEHPLLLAVGDGNHSLATAKAYWNEIRETLSPKERENHPARFALCEIENIHDPALIFEPIHRLVTGTSPEELYDCWEKYCDARGMILAEEGTGHTFTMVIRKDEYPVVVQKPEGFIPCETIQLFLDEFLLSHPEASIDYIHGAAALRQLAQNKRTTGFILPEINKKTFFEDVKNLGVLPRKTFSMGEADEKRFYMEAKRI